MIKKQILGNGIGRLVHPLEWSSTPFSLCAFVYPYTFWHDIHSFKSWWNHCSSLLNWFCIEHDFHLMQGINNFYRKGIAYISNVAVRERYRRKGIAKKLITKAEAQARSWGCRAIALHCDTSNPGAIKLYIGEGFRIIKVPEGANWPQPKTSPNMQFNLLMKLLDI